MKRTLALFLTIMLSLGMLQGVADAEAKPKLFDANLTDSLDYSFPEWFSTSKLRALLTFALSIDVYSAFGEDVSLNQTYVAFAEPDCLSVAYVDEKNNRTMLVTYNKSQQAGLRIYDAWTDDDAEEILGSTHDGVLKNKKESVQKAVGTLNELMSKNVSATVKPTATPKRTVKPTATPPAELWGLTVKGLATRSGPSTSYKDTGSYHDLNGKWVRVRSRAWDSVNEIWWVEVLIGDRWLWTGYWRFDSSTLPLESIPIY